MSTTTLSAYVFSEVLAKIASTNPSPGGGAAGALVVALGIACGRKAVRISQKHKPDSEYLSRAEAQLNQISIAVQRLADADGAAFEALLNAYKLPKITEAEAATRRATISKTATHAAAVGLEINNQATLATDALAIAKPDINTNIISDYNAALVLLSANRSIQDENIAVNSDIAARFSK